MKFIRYDSVNISKRSHLKLELYGQDTLLTDLIIMHVTGFNFPKIRLIIIVFCKKEYFRSMADIHFQLTFIRFRYASQSRNFFYVAAG